MSDGEVRIGTAGWSIPRAHAALFPGGRSHLERYARVLPAVEIDSTFYRSHRMATYARWSASVPDGFRFSVKAPREITHRRRLLDTEPVLGTFLQEVRSLGAKLGPLLVQLPPSLAFEARNARAFFETLRTSLLPLVWRARVWCIFDNTAAGATQSLPRSIRTRASPATTRAMWV